MQRRQLIQSVATLAVSSLIENASAQTYPSKAIRLLIGFPAGGPTDVTMRVLADNASHILGQPVIVENRHGFGGTQPAQLLQSAAADGYTVAQIPLSVFRLPYTTKINWDPIKDISYVLNVTGYTFGLVVPADSPLETWAHFVDWAKANPEALTFGTSGAMTTPHLTMELIAQKLGLELQHFPYSGSLDLLKAVLGGHVMAAADATSFYPQVVAGELRVLNTWGEQRHEKFPDAPTLKELGLGRVKTSPFGIGAPRATPPEIVKRLHDAFKKGMREDNYRAVLARYDMGPIYMSTSGYTKFAHDTVIREKGLIEKLGFVNRT